MSKKSPKIAALIADCAGHPQHDPHYLGYFKCFNQQLFYEAHDVLEELWLADKYGANGNFYKGLIQFAGAFVHLQKNRLGPSAKLFQLALNNFSAYPAVYQGLRLSDIVEVAVADLKILVESDFQIRPWSTTNSPQLSLPD